MVVSSSLPVAREAVDTWVMAREDAAENGEVTQEEAASMSPLSTMDQDDGQEDDDE